MQTPARHGSPAHTAHHNSESDSRIWAFLAYLLSALGFVLVMLTRKEDAYAKFHAKQSLVLFLAMMLAWIARMIPFIGWLVGWVLTLLLLILWVIGMVNALNGKQTPLPVIGHLADKIDLS